MRVLRKPASFMGSLIAFVGGFVFVGVISSCLITIGIWPGEIKLLAPFFCTDAQPDAFVVADTYSPRPGETVTNFSLYCMGPRGDATDHGFMKPFLLISLIHGILVMLLIAVFGVAGRFLRRPVSTTAGSAEISNQVFAEPEDDGTSTRSPAPPGSTSGPFVD